MIGRLYIDGNDAYSRWGVYVTKGGWNELVAFPPLKDVTANEWQEEDGIETDLDSPQLNAREVTIQFAYGGLFNRFLEFIELLCDSGYHEFRCEHIGRNYTLRLTQMSSLDAAKEIGKISLKFADDFPMQGYHYQAPQSSVTRAEDYLVDGRPFTDYGCRILEGTLSEVMKMPAVKPNLLRNIATLPGAIYDDGAVTLMAKEVRINCLMRAASLAELWRNYDALLYDLIRPQERELEVQELGQAFPFYYKRCVVTEFYPDGKIWLRFTLTLTFTHSLRIEAGGPILIAEDGAIIETEPTPSYIDLGPLRN